MKKIFFLLSSKCSGSSAFQHYFIENYKMDLFSCGEHHENETLYWTKVAFALNLYQDKLHRSNAYYSPSKAIFLLDKFAKENGMEQNFNFRSETDYFNLLKSIASNKHKAVFEKSPHHLYNRSNIELILNFKDHVTKVLDVVLVALIRNPLDTIYSAWDRWNFNCQAYEKEWFQTYNNLRQLLNEGVNIKIFRYEDLVFSNEELDHFLTQKHELQKIMSKFNFNSKSIHKWDQDIGFNHSLNAKTIELAKSFGYEERYLLNNVRNKLIWLLNEKYNSLKYSYSKSLQPLIGKVKS